MDDVADDTANGGRVTRARRKRLVSIESETSSRPGTPISPPRSLRGNSKVETETLPKRITRRNSVTNTPQKTPSKVKEIDGADMGTPSIRTRRRSVSITEENTPQKLIKSQKHLSALPEEDVKDKPADKKTSKRSTENSSTSAKSKSPIENTENPNVRKPTVPSKKVLQMELDSDNDIEVINLADTSYESSDAFEKITEKPSLKFQTDHIDNKKISIENTAAQKLPNAETPIIENLIPQSQDVFETTIDPIDSCADSENLSSLNDDEKCVATTPNSSKIVAAEQSKSIHSKSVTFDNGENMDESKIAYPKTPAFRKKGASPLASIANIDIQGSINLTDLMMGMENENTNFDKDGGSHIKIVIETSKDKDTPIKPQFQAIESRCSTPNIPPQTDIVTSNTPTPEKMLRSGKKYGESPTAEHNKSNEMNTENHHQNKSPNKELKLQHTSIEVHSEHDPTINKFPEKIALQNQLINSSLTKSPERNSVQTLSENKTTECEQLETFKNITSTHSSSSSNLNLSQKSISNETAHTDNSSPTKDQTVYFTQIPKLNAQQKDVQESTQSSSSAKKRTSKLALTPKSNNIANENLKSNSSASEKQTNSTSSPKPTSFKMTESPKPDSIHKGQEDNLIETHLLSPSKLTTTSCLSYSPNVKIMKLNFERESSSSTHLSSPVSKQTSDKNESLHSDILENESQKENMNKSDRAQNSFQQVYEMQILGDCDGNKPNESLVSQDVSKNRENDTQTNLNGQENANDIANSSNPIETDKETSAGKQFSKSWSQSVRKSSNKIDFIEEHPDEKSPQVNKETNFTEENRKSAKKTASKIIDDSSDEDENEDCDDEGDSNKVVNEELRSFFEGEAMSMGKNYESGDSMDEEERELYAEYNIENDGGESIGSQDTSEDDRYDDIEDENNSFIVPSDEEEEEEEAMLLMYSDDSEHTNNASDISVKEKPKKKVFKRIQKIVTDSEDETALKLEVTHMIDETINDQGEDRIESSSDEEAENENTSKQQDSEEKSPKNQRRSLIETKRQNAVEEVSEETQETRRSKKQSLMELDNQVCLEEEQNAENQENPTSVKQRRSQNMSLKTNNNELCYEEDSNNKDAEQTGSSTKSRRSRNISLMEHNEDSNNKDAEQTGSSNKSRRSRNISLMEHNEANVEEEQNMENPKKETPAKQRRSRNITLLENHEHHLVEEESTETNKNETKAKTRRSQNITLSKIVFEEDLEAPHNNTSAKRRSRNKSLAEQTENDLVTITIAVKENNSTNEEIKELEHSETAKKHRRSHSNSLLNDSKALGVENLKKNRLEKLSRHTPTEESFDSNHIPKTHNKLAQYSRNNSPVKENNVDLSHKEETTKRRSSRMDLQMQSNQEAVEEEKSTDLSAEKSFQSQHSHKISSNSISEENNNDGYPKKTSKNLVHTENHVVPQKTDSDIESSESDCDFNRDKILNECNESVAKESQKRTTMKTQLSKSFNETLKEQKAEKKRKLSVSFVVPKTAHNEIDAAEANDESEITHSTKKIKLSFEETSNGETLKIQGRNTSTPFVNKNVHISCNNQTDISKLIARCNQMLEDVEKSKKLSKENKFGKEKKKKLKPKATGQVVEQSAPSIEENITKRVALQQAVQASQRLLTKPSKKRQRRDLAAQDEENKYEFKRLPADILAAISSSDGDSPNIPEKRKKGIFTEKQRIGRNVFKSISGDIIVESPISMPAPKKPKTVEVIKTSSGKVIVEPITPLSKKNNNAGFRESPVTPVATGWKMRQLLLKSNYAQSPVAEKKRKRRFATATVEPTNSLPQPSWTKTAGNFKVDKLPRDQIRIIRHTGATQFGIVALDDNGMPVFSKRAQMHDSGAPIGLNAAERAMNFRESTIYRKDTAREETHQLMRRKKILH